MALSRAATTLFVTTAKYRPQGDPGSHRDKAQVTRSLLLLVSTRELLTQVQSHHDYTRDYKHAHNLCMYESTVQILPSKQLEVSCSMSSHLPPLASVDYLHTIFS